MWFRKVKKHGLKRVKSWSKLANELRRPNQKWSSTITSRNKRQATTTWQLIHTQRVKRQKSTGVVLRNKLWVERMEASRKVEKKWAAFIPNKTKQNIWSKQAVVHWTHCYITRVLLQSAADSLGRFNPGPAFPKHTKGTIHLCFQMLSLVRAKPDLLYTVRFIYMLLLTL